MSTSTIPTSTAAPTAPASTANLDDVRRVIDSSTGGAVAGIRIEPIQGYGGVIPAPPGYLREAAAMVREAGGLFICDEVQTGFGRTGESWWRSGQYRNLLRINPPLCVTAEDAALFEQAFDAALAALQ